jgi:hypothetical protein
MTTLGNPWNGNTDATDPLVGADVKTWLDAIRTVINGGIDNTNIAAGAAIALSKLEYGLLRNHLGASVQEKYMRGSKSVATGAGTSYAGANALITYKDDCDTPTGATAFSVAPRVYYTPIDNGAAAVCVIATHDTTPGTTTVQMKLRLSGAGNLPATVVVHWLAIGTA